LLPCKWLFASLLPDDWQSIRTAHGKRRSDHGSHGPTITVQGRQGRRQTFGAFILRFTKP
jgi:hypothetical protein